MWSLHLCMSTVGPFRNIDQSHIRRSLCCDSVSAPSRCLLLATRRSSVPWGKAWSLRHTSQEGIYNTLLLSVPLIFMDNVSLQRFRDIMQCCLRLNMYRTPCGHSTCACRWWFHFGSWSRPMEGAPSAAPAEPIRALGPRLRRPKRVDRITPSRHSRVSTSQRKHGLDGAAD